MINTKKEELLTAERARELFFYDSDRGEIIWRGSRMRSFNGLIAGTVMKDGYRIISVRGVKFLAHRVAHLMFYGWWPRLDLDHINGIKDDNRIDNLREATKSQNAANQDVMSHNRLGVKGIHMERGKFVVQVGPVSGKRIIGRFSDMSAARSAHGRASREIFGEYARHSESKA